MKYLFITTVLICTIVFSCKKTDTNSKPVAVDLTILNDSIKLNPYGYTPLSAIVNFSSTLSGETVIIVKGKHGDDTNIKQVFNDNGFQHSIEVIGLYANYLNEVDIRLINNNGDTVAKTTIQIQTNSLPPNLPTSLNPDVLMNIQLEAGLNLVSNLTTDKPNMPYIVDSYGDIRWILDFRTHPLLNHLKYDVGIKRLRNGNYIFGDISTDKIYEVSSLGKVLNVWDINTSGYIFHHDIYEKPDGNFIVSASKIGSLRNDGIVAVEDYIIELDRLSGSIKTVWDLKESLDQSRFILGTAHQSDWAHVNSVLYDSTDNTIIVSTRLQGVAKLTFDNQVKWILAPHRGWGTNGRGEDLNKFLLTPLNGEGTPITDTLVLNGNINHPDFEWNWYQHCVIQIPNGNLMLFDNGAVRNYDGTAKRYSRAVEFKIDPVHNTVQQKWQYGKERGSETFSGILSSVQFLKNTNHVLFCPGYEVPNSNGTGGKIIEVDYNTKQVVLQLSISGGNIFSFHRAQRINAYP